MSERDGPFHFEVDQVRRLRDVLESAGYTDRGISETLRGEQLAGLGAKKIKPLLRRTAGGSPLETLIRLFVLGAAVERPAAVRALSPLPVEDMVELGLLRTEGASLRATAEL